jgi:hypothetical protein
MEPIGWQLILRSQDERALVPSDAARRRAVRAVLRVAEPAGLLAFAFADTHLHLVVLCSRPDAGQVARRLALSLGRLLGLRFAPARIRPVQDQRHLGSLLHYVLRQAQHHGLASDAHREGSAVHELVGTRRLKHGMPGRMRERLPRVDREQVRAHLPAAGDERIDLALLAESAAAAFALPDLAGRGRAQHEARRAAVHAAKGVVTTAALAAALGLEARSVRRLATEACPTGDARAVRLQMGMRARPPPGPPTA